MSLEELDKARMTKAQEGLQQSIDPTGIFEILTNLHEIFGESSLKCEDLGLDEKQAVISLIDDKNETLRAIFNVAVKFKI